MSAVEFLVIGAGPAGLQLAQLFQASGHDYLVLEAADVPGAFFTRYPRHRTLISINKAHTGTDDPELNLRLDWNSLLSDDPALRFTRYSERYFPAADDLVRYLADFAEGLNVRYRHRVTRIDRDESGFSVAVEGHEPVRARVVVLATGVPLPNLPKVEGIELAEPYTTVSVDPVDFTDQRVLVLGKGNSAFETADALLERAAVIHVAGPHSVKFAWRTHFVGHLRAVNNNFLDTYQLKSANAVLDGECRRIERAGDADGGGYRVTFAFTRAGEVLKDLRYDRVIVATGFRFDGSVFGPSARPETAIDGRFPAQTPAFESVNVPGLYFAGTITQQRDFKRSTNGFIHGFRYGARALHRILLRRYAGLDWPATTLGPDPETVADAVIARVNRTSALWQQFAVLADVVTVSGGGARYLEEVPVDLHAAGELGRPEHAFVVTLEYGPEHDRVDPFDVSVNRIAQNSPGEAHAAAYLHPVVRYHRDGVPTATHHLAENLENRWDRPDVHRAPLVAFLARCLEPVGA